MAGCPIGNLALELNETHPAARHILEQNFKAWRDVVRSALDGASDRLPEGVETEGLATFVLTTMEGAVILARTTGVSSPLTPQSRNSAITLTGCSPTEQPGRLRKKDQSTEEAQRDSSKKEE